MIRRGTGGPPRMAEMVNAHSAEERHSNRTVHNDKGRDCLEQTDE